MRPKPDIPSRQERVAARRERDWQREFFHYITRRFPHLRLPRKREDEGGEAVPVDPNRPSHLSGGAAAELDLGE